MGKAQVMLLVRRRIGERHRAVTLVRGWKARRGCCDIPPLGDFVPGYEAIEWLGIGVPRNTPTQIIDKLNREINAALADPTFTARLADLGTAPMAMTAADFGKLIADETEKWGKVIRAANIKAE